LAGGARYGGGLISSDVLLLWDEALQSPRWTAGARIGKGIQDIDFARTLPFSIAADWTGRKRTFAFCGVRLVLAGSEKSKTV
jgi:hypothetical protein